MEAFFKFLKLKSLIFKKHLADKLKPSTSGFRPNPALYHLRHCENFLANPKGLVNYYKYHFVDYDNIVD